MIQQESVSTISKLSQLLAAHGVYALTIIFIFYQQWRAVKNLNSAKPPNQIHFRRVHISAVAGTFVLVILSSIVWIYATFFYPAKSYIQGYVAGLTKRDTDPRNAGGPPKIMEAISPESLDLNLYIETKDENPAEGKYNLGWVLFPPANMQSVVFVLQHEYEVAKAENTLSLDPHFLGNSIERKAIEKKFTLNLQEIAYSPGTPIQLMYEADHDDQVQKIGKIYLRTSHGPICIPWEEIAPDKKVARRKPSKNNWLLRTVYAGSEESSFKENGDYDPALGRMLEKRLSDSDLKTQLMARDVLVSNGTRSFKFIRDTLNHALPSDHNSLLVSNLGAAVLEIESEGNNTPRDIQLALAKSFYDVGDNESSALFFNKAGDKPFDQVDFYFYRGWAYFKTGQYDKSIESLREFAARDQDPYAKAVAHYSLGLNYGKRHRDQDAILAYKAAIKLYPNFPSAYNNIAYLYADRGIHLDKALSLANQALALERDPNELANQKDTKGWILYKMGRCKEALPFVQDAAATLTTDDTIKKHLKTLQKTKPCN